MVLYYDETANTEVNPKQFVGRVRGLKEKKVELRWQYSKPERKWLGEIENAAISTEYTGLVMSRTIAKYQFFSDVARKYSLPTKGRTQQEMRNYRKGYFKIPEAKIDGTEINKYGKLAGKYVPQTIYKDIAVSYQHLTLPTIYHV